MQLSIKEILSCTNGKCLNPKNNEQVSIEEIFTDSRQKVYKGLFVPIQGEKFDGHDYIQDVVTMGAIATLTSQESPTVYPNLITIFVEDTKKALLDLAEYYNEKFNQKVIAVTGSVGKTTTKEMIATVLETKFKVHKTIGNYNNDIGVPKTIFSLSDDDEISVIEMGMNHFNELSKLTQVAKPDFAVITNIGTAHIENLGSREGILQAKLEILEGLKPGGIVIVNGDEPLLLEKKQDDWITFGFSQKADYHATNVTSYGVITEAVIYTPTTAFKIRIPSPGKHMALNAMIAIIIAEKLGISQSDITKGLNNYKTEKMRMQITSHSDLTLIDDTYNASYDSMVAAIKVLENYITKNRRIAILGDIFELGDYTERIHKELGEYISERRLNCVYTIGSASKITCDTISSLSSNIEVVHFDSKEDFINSLDVCIKPSDTVLVKASRGMHLEEIVKAIRKER